jgi:hypothetical protein
MSFRRAWYYFFLQQHYFSGLAMVLGLLILGLNAIFGIPSANVGVPSFLQYYLPAILVCELMALWLQRYNVRPRCERGLLLAGRLASLAAWPVYFMAFVEVVTGKRLRYKVTPKGATKSEVSASTVKTFSVHLSIAAYSLICFVVAIVRHHDSAATLFCLVISAIAMLCIPFAVQIDDYLSRVAVSRPTGIGPQVANPSAKRDQF